MLLLRLRKREDGSRDGAVLRDLTRNPRGRKLRAAPSIPVSIVQELGWGKGTLTSA